MHKNTKVLYLLMSLMLFSCNTGFSQLLRLSPEDRAKVQYENAVAYLQDRNFQKAELSLKRAIELDSTYISAYLLLADLYFNLGNDEDEIKFNDLAFKLEPENHRANYNLGTAYLRTGNYHKSAFHYKKFITLEGISERFKKNAEERLKKAEFGIYHVENPVPFEPQNAGPGINTENYEYWPAITADESTLYFTRRIPDERAGFHSYREDIFVSHKIDGEWQTATYPKGSLNSSLNEGAISISPDGRYIIFTGCNRPDGYGNCDLYYSRLENNRWTTPVNLGPPVNSAAQETQPSISYDGRTIYFSSSRSGGYGGMDIWKSTLDENGRWGKPVNLGPGINTPGDEQSPFIHPDDQTLYFSSDGHPGLGGVDIFYSRRNMLGEFDTAINIGYPINSHKDEIALVVSANGRKAFFASTNEPSYGGLDIFSFELHEEARPQLVTYLKGKVFDAITSENLEAQFEIIDLESGKTLLKSKSDALTGEFLVSLPANKNYAINVSKSKYLFYSQNLSLKQHPSADPFIQDIPLTPIKVGETIILNNVFFDTDKYTLRAESKAELNKLIDFLEDNPSVKIELGGHTDDRGSREHNQRLSEQRAKAVYNYLITEGKIESNRLTFKGYGQNNPIATNTTEEGRQKNRRTELKIISN